MTRTKSINIHSFYSNKSKIFKWVKSYCKDPNIVFILQSCMMIPLSYKKELTNYEWIDQFSNILKLHKTTYSITYNTNFDKSINRDLFSMIHPKSLLNASSKCIIYYCLDEDYQKLWYLYMLGFDNVIRSYCFDNDFHMIPPIHAHGILKLFLNEDYGELDKEFFSKLLDGDLIYPMEKIWMLKPSQIKYVKEIDFL